MFYLWCFDGCVGGAWWDLISLSPELEVVNDGFHVVFHRRPARRGELAVIDLDVALRHLVQTLVNDAERFAHFLDATQIPIEAVTSRTNRHVELHQIVGVVGRSLANVPLNIYCVV